RFRCLAQGIQLIAFKNRSAQRKIDYPDVVRVLQADGRVDGGDYGTVGAVAVLVEDAEIDNVRVGSDSFEVESVAVADRPRAVPGDNPGYVPPVAIMVVGAAAHEIVFVDDSQFSRCILKIGMVADAAVDHGNPDAGAIQVILSP